MRKEGYSAKEATSANPQEVQGSSPCPGRVLPKPQTRALGAKLAPLLRNWPDNPKRAKAPILNGGRCESCFVNNAQIAGRTAFPVATRTAGTVPIVELTSLTSRQFPQVRKGVDRLESLFPMSEGEKRQSDANIVRKVLLNERAMREKVFKANESLMVRKVAEIDQALESLDRLEKA